MSIVSGYKKFKKYILTSSGFQLVSHWTKANTLEFDDGKTAQAKLGAIDGISSSRESNSDKIAASTALVSELNSDLGGVIWERTADGLYYEYQWGADTVRKKCGSLDSRDFIAAPSANSGGMSWNLTGISNYKNLVLWESLFPRMISDLDMANWNTSMLRTGVGYNWAYDANTGRLSIASRHPECVLVQYGTGLLQRTVRVYYVS